MEETKCRWTVRYDLAYDGGGEAFTRNYYTKWLAKLGIFFNRHVLSWGGTATLIDNKKES